MLKQSYVLAVGHIEMKELDLSLKGPVHCYCCSLVRMFEAFTTTVPIWEKSMFQEPCYWFAFLFHFGGQQICKNFVVRLF